MPAYGLCSIGNTRSPNVDGPARQRLLLSIHRARSIPTTATGRRREQIRADLKLISPYTHAIRTYSARPAASSSCPASPPSSASRSRSASGSTRTKTRNEREIQSAIALARRYSNVNAIVVGNETTLRAEKIGRRADQDHPARQAEEPGAGHHRRNLDGLARPSGARLGGRLHRRAHPALLGGLRRLDKAVDQTIVAYDKLRRAHPGKRIVIAEFGWPSAGYNMHDANPGPHRAGDGAARFRRARRGLWHRLQHHRSLRPAVEDQRRRRRHVLGHVRRLAQREVRLDRAGRAIPTTGSSPGSRSCSACCCRCRSWRRRARPPARRSRSRSPPMWSAPGSPPSSRSGKAITSCPAPPSRSALGIAAADPAGRHRARAHRGDRGHRLRPQPAPPDRRAPLPAPQGFAPKVSIHVPAYREPPEMLKATLDAVARLDYPNFECVVVINNTPDPAFWRPIEEHCRALGERFKFINEDNVDRLQGRRAAARARAHRAPTPRSSASSTPTTWCIRTGSRIWCRPSPIRKVGMVQAPQDHRDGDRTPHAPRHERRICRLLRHRHGPAQRGQRHHRARHDVPDPPRRARCSPAAGRATRSSRTPISA